MTTFSIAIAKSRSTSSDQDRSLSSCFFTLAAGSRCRICGMRWVLLSVTLLLIARPAVSLAQAPRQPVEVAMFDVELGPQGQWSGKIVNAEGIGVTSLPARLSNGRGVVATLVTDREGRFALSKLPTGAHLLEYGGVPRFYRFWKHGTAPPRAVRHSLIVTQGNVIRGVQGSRVYEWLCDHPALTYTGIAAAIVVPVVLVGSNHGSSPASP